MTRPLIGPIHRPISFSSHKLVDTMPITSASEILFEDLTEPQTETFFWNIADVSIDTDDRLVMAQIGTGATPTYQTANYVVANGGYNSTAGALTFNDASSAGVGLTGDSGAQQLGSATGEVLNGRIFIDAPSGANWKTIHGWTAFNRQDGALTGLKIAGQWQGGKAAMTALKFFCASATMHFNGGRISLYAVRYK